MLREYVSFFFWIGALLKAVHTENNNYNYNDNHVSDNTLQPGLQLIIDELLYVVWRKKKKSRRDQS